MPELNCAKKKVKILFVVDDLQRHGVTTSLVNLLNAIEFLEYDISLLVLNREDSIAEKTIPSSIKRIQYDDGIELFFQPWKKSVLGLIKQRRWKLLFYRFKVYLYTGKVGAVKALQRNWEQIISSLPKLDGEFDTVIGFQDYFSGVFALEKVNSTGVIGWNHNIYQKMGYDDDLTEKYYRRLNLLCTISGATKESLIQVFGEELNSKIVLVPNAINTEEIDALSKKALNDMFFKTEKVKILSIGRLVNQKGFDFAVKIGGKLKQDGVSFVWYILGEGAESTKLTHLIEEAGLTGSMVLYGFAENPYPFMKACDVYVQPSRYEGFGIAISEANYLGAPLVITPDAGDRFTESEFIHIIPFGNENQWAMAIEDTLGKRAKFKTEKTNGNASTISAFSEVLSRLTN